MTGLDLPLHPTVPTICRLSTLNPQTPSCHFRCLRDFTSQAASFFYSANHFRADMPQKTSITPRPVVIAQSLLSPHGGGDDTLPLQNPKPLVMKNLKARRGPRPSRPIPIQPRASESNLDTILEQEVDAQVFDSVLAHSGKEDLARADLVKDEMVACFELVRRMGKGAVYLGSSRIPEDHKFFKLTEELGREVSVLLGCTTWSGIGPGLMEAATRGAREANMPVAGLKILLEAGQSGLSSWEHPYLPPSSYITCRSIAARKLGFLEAGGRIRATDRTAFFALPGGIGTLDEIFDILTLIQLKKMETPLKVPFLAMNYGGCLRGLLQYFEELKGFGAVAEGEVDRLWRVCDNNLEALDFLADFYEVEESRRKYKDRTIDSRDA